MADDRRQSTIESLRQLWSKAWSAREPLLVYPIDYPPGFFQSHPDGATDINQVGGNQYSRQQAAILASISVDKLEAIGVEIPAGNIPLERWTRFILVHVDLDTSDNFDVANKQATPYGVSIFRDSVLALDCLLLASGGADSADKQKNLQPINSDVAELCRALEKGIPSGKTANAIAREFCAQYRIDNWKSLLRSACRFRHLWPATKR